jgi:hypothetical protein
MAQVGSQGYFTQIQEERGRVVPISRENGLPIDSIKIVSLLERILEEQIKTRELLEAITD